MKKVKENTIEENLLLQGVTKLKKFGFVNVSKTNITTDEVYSLYFSKMLKEMLGGSLEKDLVINQMLETIDALIK